MKREGMRDVDLEALEAVHGGARRDKELQELQVVGGLVTALQQNQVTYQAAAMNAYANIYAAKLNADATKYAAKKQAKASIFGSVLGALF